MGNNQLLLCDKCNNCKAPKGDVGILNTRNGYSVVVKETSFHRVIWSKFIVPETRFYCVIPFILVNIFRFNSTRQWLSTYAPDVPSFQHLAESGLTLSPPPPLPPNAHHDSVAETGRAKSSFFILAFCFAFCFSSWSFHRNSLSVFLFGSSPLPAYSPFIVDVILSLRLIPGLDC